MKPHPFRYLYLISSPQLGLYKIGVADDVDRRLAQLQAKSAFPLRVEHAYRVFEKAALVFESTLHEFFASCRTHGEWFQLTPEQVADTFDRDIPLTFGLRRVYSAPQPGYASDPIKAEQ